MSIVPPQQAYSSTVVCPSGRATAPYTFQIAWSTTVVGSGFSHGNSGGWTVNGSQNNQLNIAVRGINQVLGFAVHKHAVGDTAGLYGYVWSDGGVSAESDEGVAGIQLEQSEYPDYFHGTVASTTGKGDRAPKFTFVSGNNWVSDGAFMLNLSKAKVAGNILAPSIPLPGTYLNYLPTSPGIPLTTAWGLVAGALGDQEVTADSPVYVTVTAQLQPIGGVLKPFTTGMCQVAGVNQPEQSHIAAVSAVSSQGTQQVTLQVRNANAQAYLFQGGIAGTYISLGANLRYSGMRSSYYAFGSLTGADVIYGVNVQGTLVGITIPQDSEAATDDGGPSSDFLLVPGAEVVANPVFNGAFGTLESNGVAWAAGDLVENPHYPVWGGTVAWFTKWHVTPANARQGSAGLVVQVGGPGFAGGNTSVATVQNTNPATNYKGNGGPTVAPDLLRILGPGQRSIYIGNAPEPGNPVVMVQNPVNPNDPGADVLAYQFAWLPGANLWFRNGRWWFDTTVAAGGFAIKDQLGASGTFQSADGKTVTVQGGLITSIE